MRKELVVKIIRLVEKTIVSSLLMCSTFTIPFSSQAGTPTIEGAVITCPYMPGGLSKTLTCNGLPVTCVGTAGHDLIWGTDASDVIYAGAGNDIIQADAGNDTVCGGEGNDTIHGGRGYDAIFGEGGADVLFGARDDDTLYGGEGDFDVLFGGPGIDNLNGGPGAYDTCLKQRDGGLADVKTCETIFPPPGYNHEEEHQLGPGIIGPR